MKTRLRFSLEVVPSRAGHGDSKTATVTSSVTRAFLCGKGMRER